MKIKFYPINKILSSEIPNCLKNYLEPCELQLMFSLAFINSQEKRYIIHPQKSTAQRRCVTSAVRKDEVIDSWQLGSKEVQVEPKLTHLGLLRAEKAESTVNIVERISVARRTLYALIKTGVHGTNGLNPRISYRIYQVYVRGARWLSGRVSDSGARGPGFETYRRRVVSLSKTLYSPKVLVNYPGSDGSVPT